MHTVKCGRFHSTTEALVTAYSKEFSNESCGEASKTLVMRSHSVLRAKKNPPATVLFLHCQRKHQSIKTRRD